MPSPPVIEKLINKGVRFSAPRSVEIGEEVSLERISGNNVIINGSVRILGADTLISAGSKIGDEGPVTIVNCQLGRGVELKGGFFQASVFLDGASLASGAHVREGSLLEEEARVGHTVGLKQTILLPYVTLGSLINFCDCLMAGGTGKEDHSEVGSSYIHFNYTPQQDKATPSLIGDVPRGVMLDQLPIFLGGQGGLVGPVTLDYGTVITAGSVWRHDSSGVNLLHGSENRPRRQAYLAGLYGDIRRKTVNNILYIANLRALQQWYFQVRRPFFQRVELGEALFQDSLRVIDGAIEERLKRFRSFVDKLPTSVALGEERDGKGSDIYRWQRELMDTWQELEAAILAPLDEDAFARIKEVFLENLEGRESGSGNYLEWIRELDGDTKRAGTQWLQKIVDTLTERSLNLLPSFTSRAT